ncbi:hypothetical protein MNAN1_001162 [Malassezia nana]|uniref:Uncharacterized protein n=1 Tax=Malassezia nana TaxID=180528 RepID=A0AAF0J6M7_9BASI|nr:hypothetical protein MNAN1_001162 [Malassezia nana]
MSTLQVLDDNGSVSLVPGETGHLSWHVPARRETAPALAAVTKAQQWCPHTGRYAIPFSQTTLAHERALHALAFLRRYHTGIDVPSHVLAETILEDEQTALRQADQGQVHAGPTTLVLSGTDGEAWLVCVGGENRSDLCKYRLLTTDISTIRRHGNDVQCAAAALTALQTTAPIQQVVQVSEQCILVRTWTTTFVGCIEKQAPDATGPRFVVRVLAHIHTGAAVPTRQVNAAATPWHEKQVHLIDAHGTLRAWDLGAQTWYVYALTQFHSHAAAQGRGRSCVDAGSAAWPHYVGRFLLVAVASMAHSVDAMRRSHITSIAIPTLSWDASLIAMATTDAVEYYDARYPSVPLGTWAHRRGFDRTLTLSTMGTAEHAILCLSSQRNRLRSLYDVRREKSYLTCAMPSLLRTSMLAHEPCSPTQPCFVDMTQLPGWNDWAPPHRGTVLYLEQTMRGAVYAQWLGPHTGSEAMATGEVQWSHYAQQVETQARSTHDEGPFGEQETTPVDYRAVYQAALLGTLGTDTPDAPGPGVPERLTALLETPTELAHVPHTLNTSGRAGSSLIHHEGAAHGSALLSAKSRDALERVWAAYPRAPLSRLVDPTAPGTARDWMSWLQQRQPGVPPLPEAEAEEALDVALATTWVPGPCPSDEPKPLNGNWRWDEVGTPTLPSPPPLSNPAGEKLSEAATMLLMEWPLGAPTSTYTYKNPYVGLDLGLSQRSAPAPQPPLSASQPGQPAVVRTRRRQPVEELEHEVPASQVSLPQMQLEPGRFAQRPRAPVTKKKRLGGF